MKIVALGGSIRALNAASRALVLDHARVSRDFKDFATRAKASSSLTNTEILCAAALFGARGPDLRLDYYPLARLFARSETSLHSWNTLEAGLSEEASHYDFSEPDPAAQKELVGLIRDADGILFSSPVYFGDRSSLVDRALQIANREKILKDKVVACLAVGAKRNGGQETTSLFLLQQASEAGSFVVGNGPRSAQYGGLGIGGDRGSVLNDEAGLESARETGERLAVAVRQKMAGAKAKTSLAPLQILTIIAEDDESRTLERKITGWAQAAKTTNPHWQLSAIALLDYNVSRCLACNICPIPSLRKNDDSYACIIPETNDAMGEVRRAMLGADGIILAGLSLRDISAVRSRYQIFTERTRFIRRNDFELTDVPIASLSVEEAGAVPQSLFSLKVMTSYLRHNGVLCPPIREVFHKHEIVLPGFASFENYLRQVGELKDGALALQKRRVSYKADGYRDKRLDETEAWR